MPVTSVYAILSLCSPVSLPQRQSSVGSDKELLSVSFLLSHFVLTTAGWQRYHYNFHHMLEDTEAQKFKTCLGSYHILSPLELKYGGRDCVWLGFND